MRTRTRSTTVLALLLGGFASAQTTERVSIDAGGAQGNQASGEGGPSISADGRFVAFTSLASNLVPGDSNGTIDVFVHDRQSAATIRVSVDSAGAEANANCFDPAISADGRFVAFCSFASNLVAGDTNGTSDVFVHDRQNASTERVSVGAGGAQCNLLCWTPSLSADGRFVAFTSLASNIVPGDTNGLVDVFVRDRQSAATERVSIDTAGAEANGQSLWTSISSDGRFVAFESDATSLVPGDTNGVGDIFVRDRQNSTTERVSVDSSAAAANDWSESPSISADGRFVTFFSPASNLCVGDTNVTCDVFLRDRLLGTTERVSVATSGAEGNSHSHESSVSATGRYIAFMSLASNLAASDTNVWGDVFVHDRQLARTEHVSVDSAGVGGNFGGGTPSISDDGRCVAFESYSINLVTGDTNGFRDVFARDRGAPHPGADLCQPGSGVVAACPCSNPPANAPRGCDNSAATGGAQLTSTGSAALGSDSVVFVTNGERPSATSVVLQGSTEIATGLAFGQGVRCVGGQLKRLYVQSAAGGSITAPGPGDPSVSARSAALGDPILAGASRWYAVYYRDPIVVGGCPAASTFNVTQTQLVIWSN